MSIIKAFLDRSTRNQTIGYYYGVRVYENAWMHTYKVQFKSQIHFEDKLYEHIHRDKISVMSVNYLNRRSPINEKEED